VQITANSLEGQLSQLDKQFLNVEATAKSFETLNGKATAILHAALDHSYAFGEALMAVKGVKGINVTREFFVKHAVAYNSRTQANPYIGLMKLAFKNSSDSSRSQYATVLAYAASSGIAPKDFADWIKDGGVEGRRKEAVEAQANSSAAKRDQGRATMVQQAETALLAKPMSASVALPAGVQAPEGFALVLARIDGSNGAQIVDIVHTDAEKVEPILLSLVDYKPPVSNDPLAPFFRAVDLIINTTPDKPQGKERHLMICNVERRGHKQALVEAISQAHSFPGAAMTLDGHIGDLPEDKPFILEAGDARHLLNELASKSGWAIDSAGSITADKMLTPITLHELADPGEYRVAEAKPSPEKPLKTLSTDFQAAARYIEHERAAHARRRADRGETRTFPGSVELSIQDAKLSIRLPQSMMSAPFGETSAVTDFDEKTVAVSDIESLVTTLARHDVDANGWIMDTDVEDAALVLEAYFDHDVYRVVMPTRTGSDYNKVCQALAL
jgi:hypothetical protein